MKKEHEQVSQVFDNGRRGVPLVGCDCVVCFGYCLDFTGGEAIEHDAKQPTDAEVES